LVHGDFEKAAHNAFRSKFNCTIKGCLFHFTQALMRQIKEKGCYCLYRDNETVNKWFQLFKSLPFLPLDKVNEGFEYIKKNIPDADNKNLQAFLEYFYMTWMNEDGKDSFPPIIWNHHNTTDSPRTNNHMEGFNRSLNFHVITSKPTIYELIINLKTIEIQISAYFKNRVFNGLLKKKNRNIEDIERDIKIAQLKYRFLNDQITLESYMKSSAFIYSY
jgi:hypothetical protein